MGGLGMAIITILLFAVLIGMVIIGAILIGVFFTGLAGGVILLVTGKHFSKDTRNKIESRICIGVGIVFLIIAGASAGVFINYAVKFFG